MLNDELGQTSAPMLGRFQLAFSSNLVGFQFGLPCCLPLKDTVVQQKLLAQLQQAPASVRSHYQRMLLEWIVGALSKACTQPAAPEQPSAKKQKLNSGEIQAMSLVP